MRGKLLGKTGRVATLAILLRLSACALLALLAGTTSVAAGAARVVRYHGVRIVVPPGWPVYDLASQPLTCVRFDRHAIYLGQPSADQRCPPHAVGRTEAILVEPTPPGSSAGTGGANPLPSQSTPGTQPPGGSFSQITMAGKGVLVTATWSGHRDVVARALGLRSLPAAKSAAPAATAPAAGGPAAAPAAGAQGASAAAGGTYRGLGFDTCSAPSSSDMSAWRSSPYHAVGIYIGGAEVACSQPNLDSAWVRSQSAAGWHLLPTYVGLQAPGNSCGCASIDPGQASSEGDAAARDAVSQAQRLGMKSGNPIYYDMEAYATGGSDSSTALSFLAAWTNTLHANGYKSGVYSSSASGISDLVSQYGSGYREPDDIWFAEWNGSQSTSSAYVPGGEWTNRRVHQYQGNQYESYGGVSMLIDDDYIDGQTAAAGASSPAHGYWLYTSYGNIYRTPGTPWLGSPAGRGIQTSSITGMAATLDSKGYWLVDSSGHTYAFGDAHGFSFAPASSDRIIGIVAAAGGGYWLYTAHGNIYRTPGTPWFGSPAENGVHTSSITGMSATSDGGGYWLVDSSGHVYPFGDARGSSVKFAHKHPIMGIVAASDSGYWLYTAYGNVYNIDGAHWYSSPLRRGVRTSSITGMAATRDRKGYWVVDSSGHVYPFGDAGQFQSLDPSHRVVGIVHG